MRRQPHHHPPPPRGRCLPHAVHYPARGWLIPVDDLLAAGFRLHAPAPPDGPGTQAKAPAAVAAEGGRGQDAATLRAELERVRQEHALELAQAEYGKQLAQAEAEHLRKQLAAKGEHIADLQKALQALMPAPERAALPQPTASASVPAQTHTEPQPGEKPRRGSAAGGGGVADAVPVAAWWVFSDVPRAGGRLLCKKLCSGNGAARRARRRGQPATGPRAAAANEPGRVRIGRAHTCVPAANGRTHASSGYPTSRSTLSMITATTGAHAMLSHCRYDSRCSHPRQVSCASIEPSFHDPMQPWGPGPPPKAGEAKERGPSGEQCQGTRAAPA